MSIITVDLKNIETEHICCALSSKTNEIGVSAKKEWLRQLISDGLKFKKLDARGKVFIEFYR